VTRHVRGKNPKIVIDSSSVALKGQSLVVGVKLSCETARCSGSIQLSSTTTINVLEKVRLGKKAVEKTVSKTETVLLAKAVYELARGTSGTFDLTPTANGETVLARVHTRSPLRGVLVATVKRGSTVSKRVSVTSTAMKQASLADHLGQLSRGADVAHSIRSDVRDGSARQGTTAVAARKSQSSTNSSAIAAPLLSDTSATVGTYSYNGDGLRISKTTSAGTESFDWNTTTGTPELLADGSTSFIYGPYGLPVEQLGSSDSPMYFLHDSLGSTRGLLDSSGGLAATFAYSPFGSLTSSTGSATTPILFAGGYYDSESGLYYLINRYYDPATAQFLVVDPLVQVTNQPYTYAGSDFINASDPLGLWDLLTILTALPQLAAVPILSGESVYDCATRGFLSEACARSQQLPYDASVQGLEDLIPIPTLVLPKPLNQRNNNQLLYGAGQASLSDEVLPVCPLTNPVSARLQAYSA